MKGKILIAAAGFVVTAFAYEGGHHVKAGATDYDAKRPVVTYHAAPEGLPGAVLVTADADGAPHFDCVGEAAPGRRMEPDTLFWMASNTKGVLAALVLNLVSDGVLSLDDPVEKYFPSWKRLPVKNRPTLRMLLCHTSGLDVFPKKPIVRPGMDALAEHVHVEPLKFEPDTNYLYSNWDIDVAAAIVEKVTGRPFEVEMSERIFKQLGMTDSTFIPTAEQNARRATFYRLSEGKPPQAATIVRHKLVQPYKEVGIYPEAGGGLLSTPQDMIKFFQMIARGGLTSDGRRLISEPIMEKWAKKQTPPCVKVGYSFGMKVDGKGKLSHGGVGGTWAEVNVKTRKARLYMANMEGSSKAVKAFRNAFVSEAARPSAERMDRSKLLIGAYCLQPNARTDAHVKAIHDCGVDFIIGVPAADRVTLDLFAKHGVGAIVNGVVPGWWGGDGKNAGNMRERNPPGKYAGAIAAFKDHPAIWAIDIGDEPSALDFPYYGEVVRQINKALPGMPLYLNLYPNYASVSQNTGRQTVNQLGTPTYGEHIDVYCKNVPLDYISYDFYPYTAPASLNRFVSKMYDNFIVVADACRRTKRSFWYIPQVNSRVGIAPTSVNRLRFQANAALSFGAEAVTWACWCKGWWTNNVLDSAGKQTEQYEKLRRVNMELKRIGPRYMRYRNVATRFVGFESGSPWRPKLPFPSASDDALPIRASNGAQLLVGEMVARDATSGERAFFVTAADDPTDAHPSSFEIVFDFKGKSVEVFGGEGTLPVTHRADGSCSVSIASCQGVLIVHRVK